MTPIAIYQTLTAHKSDRFILLTAGLAFFVAIAVASSLRFDLATGLTIGWYMLIAGALVLIGGRIFGDKLGFFWFCRFLMILAAFYSLAVVVAVLAPGRTFLPPAYCLIKPVEPCEQAQDRYADQRYTLPEPVRTLASTPEPVVKANYTVTLQFAGIVRREDTRALTGSLAADGWKVPEAASGGERTEAAIGFNEIRYGSDADQEAAENLMAAVQAANLTGATIRATKVSGIPAGSLEIWISRV